MLSIFIGACGKTPIDTTYTSANAVIGTASTAAALVRCDTSPACRINCDGNGFHGDKVECQWEMQLSFSETPCCDRLRACYARMIPQ